MHCDLVYSHRFMSLSYVNFPRIANRELMFSNVLLRALSVAIKWSAKRVVIAVNWTYNDSIIVARSSLTWQVKKFLSCPPVLWASLDMW